MDQVPTTSEPGARARRWRDDLEIGVAGFLVQAVVFGALYTFGVVLEPIRRDLGVGRSGVALLPSLAAFVLFFAGPLTGWLADRHGTRLTVALGGVALAAGLLITSAATSLWLAAVGFGLVAGLAASLAYVPLVAHVAALPTRRGPTLVGAVVAGVGIGTAVAAPVLTWAVDRYGWRPVYRVYGAGSVVVLALGAVVCARQRLAVAPGRAPIGAGLRRLVGDPRARRLYLVLLLVCPSLYIGLVFLPDYVTGHGLSKADGAFAASLLGLCSAGGRVVLGLAGTFAGPRRLFRASLALLAVSLAVWLVAGGRYPVLLAYAVAAGTGYGGAIGLAPSVVAESLGRDGLGSVLGALYTALGIGALATGPTVGRVIDRWGHAPAFVVVGLMAAAAAALAPGGTATSGGLRAGGPTG